MTPPRGALIALAGPDGVGKTTIAKTLLDGHAGPTAYVHFRPPIRGALQTGPPLIPVEGPPKDFGTESGLDIVVGWARLFRSFASFWAGYLRTVRPAIQGGALVVADRWAYGYIVQPRALKFYGPNWLARWVVGRMPKPNVLAVLQAPPDVVHARKDHLTLQQITEELAAWAELPCHDPLFVDANQTPERVAGAIQARLNGNGPAIRR